MSSTRLLFKSVVLHGWYFSASILIQRQTTGIEDGLRWYNRFAERKLSGKRNDFVGFGKCRSISSVIWWFHSSVVINWIFYSFNIFRLCFDGTQIRITISYFTRHTIMYLLDIALSHIKHSIRPLPWSLVICKWKKCGQQQGQYWSFPGMILATSKRLKMRQYKESIYVT